MNKYTQQFAKYKGPSFCGPAVYTFLVPYQLHRFIELMKASGKDFSSKMATQVTTSKHFYDITAHRFIEDNCADMGIRFLDGLSADMDDIPLGGEGLHAFAEVVSEERVEHDFLNSTRS